MVTPSIQEHPSLIYSRIVLLFGAIASAFSAITVLLMYPFPQNLQVFAAVMFLAFYFVAIRQIVIPRLRSALQVDLAVAAYLLPVFLVQWFSIVLMPEKEVPVGVACLIVLSGTLFISSRAFVATSLFASISWLAVKYQFGVTNEVEIMQILVMTPSVALVTRIGVRRTMATLLLAREREQQSVKALEATLAQLRDETVRRQESEARLLVAQKNESLGLMAAGIAHDFNNTLMAINSLSETISLASTEASVICHSEEISNAVQQASAICRQMLTYAGKSSTERSFVNLTTIVGELVPLLKASLSPRVALLFTSDVPEAIVLGNAGQLQQVLMNLVTNSSESIEGTGMVRIRISRRTKSTETSMGEGTSTTELRFSDYFQLEVTDDGCGMAAETVRQIFDPYYTTKSTGHGLGLSIVLGISRSHNASIQVESQPGAGTTTTMLFPAAHVESQASERPLEVATLTTLEFPQSAILVIDDDDLVRSSMASMLEIQGWNVVEADSGESALQMSRNRMSFAAVIVDYSMPNMNGPETLREMRKLGFTGPAILASGYFSDVAEAQTNDDFQAVLQKPFRRQELNAVLARLIGALPQNISA